MNLGNVFNGSCQRWQDVNLSRSDSLLHLGEFSCGIEVRAANLGAGHQNTTLAHPHLRRIKRKAVATEFFRVDHLADIGFHQRGGQCQPIAARALEDHIRQTPLVECVAKEWRYRRTNWFECAIRE